MRSSPAHCRAKLMFTLDTTCTAYAPAQLFPQHRAVPISLPAAPSALVLCSQEQHPAAVAGRQAVCWRVSDMEQPARTGNRLSRVQGWLMNDVKHQPWDCTALPSPAGGEEGQRRSRSDNDLAQLVNLHLSLYHTWLLDSLL